MIRNDEDDRKDRRTEACIGVVFGLIFGPVIGLLFGFVAGLVFFLCTITAGFLAISVKAAFW